MSTIKNESKSKFGTTHIAMIRAVVTFCFAAANAATTASIAAFNTVMTTVQSNLALIDTLRQSIAGSITGYAAQKKAYRKSLSIISNRIMKAVYTYAVVNNNLVLAAQMKTSESKLEDMKDEDLGPFTQFAIVTVSDIGESLADYGVIPTMITSWEAAQNAFVSLLSDPKNAITTRKAINTQIQTVLRQTMILLYNQADSLAFNFKNTDIVYYNSYIDNRKLYPHHHSTSLHIRVADSQGSPISSGEVFILGTDKVGFLDSNGVASIDHVPFSQEPWEENMRTVSVTTPFGNANFGPFRFKKGKSITLHAVIDTTGANTPAKVTVTEEEVTETEA